MRKTFGEVDGENGKLENSKSNSTSMHTYLWCHSIITSAVSVESGDNLQPLPSAIPLVAASRDIVVFHIIVQLHGGLRASSLVLGHLVHKYTVIFGSQPSE